MHGAQVPLLVGELGSHMLCGVAKKKKKKSTIDCEMIMSQRREQVLQLMFNFSLASSLIKYALQDLSDN